VVQLLDGKELHFAHSDVKSFQRRGIESIQLTVDRATPFREMADFLRSENISSCVLHGIDPNTGVLGRDLDIHIPDPQQAFRAAVHFSEILRSYGVRWISLMHPIWGPRCIGVQESDLTYWELHTIPRINLACIDFRKLFPVRGKEGPLGFIFDPTLYFLKVVMQKHSKSFIQRRRIWTSFTRDAYIMANKTEIEREFQAKWSNGAEFVAAALGPDTDANLQVRQMGMISLTSSYCISHPWNAARASARWLYRKADVYKCPTLPVIGIDTTIETAALRDCLIEKLGRVFIRIIVADQPMAWHIRRRMQDGQNLLIFRRDQRRKRQAGIDRWISIPTSNREDIDTGVAAILDCIIQYNKHWSSLYPAVLQSSANRTTAGSERF